MCVCVVCTYVSVCVCVCVRACATAGRCCHVTGQRCMSCLFVVPLQAARVVCERRQHDEARARSCTTLPAGPAATTHTACSSTTARAALCTCTAAALLCEQLVCKQPVGQEIHLQVNRALTPTAEQRQEDEPKRPSLHSAALPVAVTPTRYRVRAAVARSLGYHAKHTACMATSHT